MPAWVIRKTLPAHDYGLGPGWAHRGGSDGGSGGSAPTYLYWAKPTTHTPRTASWVWLSGLCPQVATFPTRTEAEAAAWTLAGPSWRTPDLAIVDLRSDASSPGRPSGPGDRRLAVAARREAGHR